MVLRTLVTKLREAKIVSSQTPIMVFTTKHNGKLEYNGCCIDIDSSSIITYLIRQCTVKDFSVNEKGGIVSLTVRIEAEEYRNVLNCFMNDFLIKANCKDEFTEYERQYNKLLLFNADYILYD